MNYIKALKIYNDRKGEKNEWCVYKKGTPEYLEVMKIMKDFKEKPIKDKAVNTISNAFKIKQAKKELEKLKLEKAEKEKIKKYWEDFKLEQEQIKKEKQKEKEEEEKEKQKELKREEAKNELDKLKLEKERKEFKKDKLFNMDDEQSLNIYNAVKNRGLNTKGLINSLIKDTKNIIEFKKKILTTTKYDDFLNLKRLIERNYKDIKKGEIILNKQIEEENIKLEEERKKFKKNKLFDIDDEQSLNIYIALKKNNIGYDEKIFDKLINNNKLIIELKKDIFEETNYDNFLNLKNKIQELYKEINEYELILDKQGEEIEKKRDEEMEKKRNEETKFMIKKNKVSPDDYIKMKDDFKSNTYEWAKQAYKEGLTDTEILSYSGIGETDYKLLNAFFTPDKIIEDMLDYSFLYQNLINARVYKQPLYILECSGGIGNIIYYILEAINNSNDPELLKYIKIDFVEIKKDFIEIAKAKLDKYKDIITYHNISFFNFKTDNDYDFIFGNPPYKMTINNKNIYDVDFFLKCWDLLSFRIIFLMSTSSLTLNTSSHKRFKEIIDNKTEKQLINDQKLFIYKNEFKDKKTTQAGQTGIKTNLYVLDKNN